MKRLQHKGLNVVFCLIALFWLGAIMSACAVPGQQSAAPADPNVTTITVWTFEVPGAPWIDAYIKKFEEQHPDIKVEFSSLPEDDYQTKVATALSAHAPPDVAII